MGNAFFIGRFQPLHSGHLEDICSIAKENENVYIGIGSTNLPVSKHNPFITEERELMLRNTLDKCISNYEIYKIPDLGDNKKWIAHVESIVPKFDTVYSGSPLIRKLFRDKGYNTLAVPFVNGINGTQIREKMYAEEPWENLVPAEARKVIEDVDGVSRVRDLMDRISYQNPIVAVDSITEYEGNIVFIKRGRYPFKGKLAFPGGHLEYGEACENCVVREVEEETGLKVEIESLLNVYSDPDRDPRGHYLTTVYRCKVVGGELKAGDDAAEVVLIPIEKAKKGLDLAFDHSKMLSEAFERGVI